MGVFDFNFEDRVVSTVPLPVPILSRNSGRVKTCRNVILRHSVQTTNPCDKVMYWRFVHYRKEPYCPYITIWFLKICSLDGMTVETTLFFFCWPSQRDYWGCLISTLLVDRNYFNNLLGKCCFWHRQFFTRWNILRLYHFSVSHLFPIVIKSTQK